MAEVMKKLIGLITSHTIHHMLDGDYETVYYRRYKRSLQETLDDVNNGFERDKHALKSDMDEIAGDIRKAEDKAKEKFAL